MSPLCFLCLSLFLSLLKLYAYIHEVYGHARNLFVLPMYSTHPTHSKASERASERADRTWTNGRTNQPTWTNEPTNQPGTKRTNESVTHSTAQPYEATAVPLPLHMKQKKFPSLRTPRLRLPSPPTAFRLPLTPTLVGRGEEKEVRATVRLCASTV